MAVFTDNFNRDPTAPGDIGPNWIVHVTSTLKIEGQKIAGQGRAFFTFGQTETPNQVGSMIWRIVETNPLLEKYGVILRGSSSAPDTLDTGYIAGFEIINTMVTYVIWKRESGVLTELARSSTPVPIPVGFDIPLLAKVDGLASITILNSSNNNIILQVTDLVTPLAGPGFGGLDQGVDGPSTSVKGDNFFLSDLEGPTPPSRPICSIKDLTTDGATQFGTAFFDKDLDTHAATHWQVALATSSDFSNPVITTIIEVGDTPADIGLTEIVHTGLDASTRYKARCRYQDSSGMWSAWSPIGFFTTLPEQLPIKRLLHDAAVYEVSCAEAPERAYRYKLIINDTLQMVDVTEIETPEGLYEWGQLLPFCVIEDIRTRMITARARFGLTISGCEQGRIEIPFGPTTPRPITVEHNCGSYPIVQLIDLGPPSGGYNYPYSVADETYYGFIDEPPAEGVWVNHLDDNTFQVNTTVDTGVIIAIFH